ncbi:enoyl-CoA hydratase/isomerase family protein [Haloarchaeobius sp. DYHT-AS-18]|uniref:enoyl-CoA hydratase/isomerase family protein n=1 Tax=Haloarchaeobius sp. DYHT-AS-18 TaxID=3446117 RepID=UPI003EBFC652
MSDATYSVTDCVAEITLDRPDARNAMNASVIESLVEHVEAAGADDEVRVIVLRATGDLFCGGGDVKKLGALLDEDTTPVERRRYITDGIHRPIQALVDVQKPVVCRMQGDAIGAGANLVLACDMIVAAEEARLIEGFKNVGLAIDCGGSYLLPHNTSLAKAKELVMTGRPVDATEAEELGLVNYAVPADKLDEKVDELVGQLRNGPTAALGLSKQLLHEGVNATFEEALENEARANTILGGSKDHAEGIAAFREKRHPEFTGE